MEKKFKIHNWLNYDYQEQQYEVNKQKSLTIPDQALSIKEILNRYARGLDIEQFKPVYDDEDIDAEDYLPDPRKLDLAEREEYKEKFQNELKSFLENQQQANETVGLTETENLAVATAKDQAPE